MVRGSHQLLESNLLHGRNDKEMECETGNVII